MFYGIYRIYIGNKAMSKMGVNILIVHYASSINCNNKRVGERPWLNINISPAPSYKTWKGYALLGCPLATKSVSCVCANKGALTLKFVSGYRVIGTSH